MRFPDREDERVRFGREPAGLEEREYLASLVPGADEYPTPLGSAPQTAGWRGPGRYGLGEDEDKAA